MQPYAVWRSFRKGAVHADATIGRYDTEPEAHAAAKVGAKQTRDKHSVVKVGTTERTKVIATYLGERVNKDAKKLLAALNEARPGDPIPSPAPDVRAKNLHAEIEPRLRKARRLLDALERLEKSYYYSAVTNKSWKNAGDHTRCRETLDEIIERLEWVL